MAKTTKTAKKLIANQDTLSASCEKDVELHFKRLIERATNSLFTTPTGSDFETDGMVEWENVRVLFEAKYGKDLNTTLKSRLDVLGQMVYYLKRFEERGISMPNVLFVADEDVCFALPTSKVLSFLSAKVDWTRAPSNPDPSLNVDVEADPDHTAASSVVSGEWIKRVCEDLANGCATKVRPNEHNISAMFEHWVKHILPVGKYTPVEMTHIFFSCLFYGEGSAHFAYTLPTKKDRIIIETKEFEVDVKAMERFFERRERGLSAKEIDTLVSMRDRLIEDDARRRQGAFYTPTLWVNEAHRLLSDHLGSDWREKYIVWDCCAGTGNLTRDYTFSNLILSTAEEPDVKAMSKEGYNKGAIRFQYDFLNPEGQSPFFEGLKDSDGNDKENRLPQAVVTLLKKGAAEGKRLVFLINPPYAEDGVAGAKGDTKKGVADTLVSRSMPRLGRANRQLYAQFLFQCEQIAAQYGYKEKTIGVFCKPAFMTSESFKGFRDYFFDKYAYQSGFMFQASHFADVSGAWGVSFTLWNEGKTDKTADLPITLKDMVGETIVSTGVKEMYNADGRTASEWVSALSPASTALDTPKFSSGLSVREVEGNNRGVSTQSLGVLCNKGNNLMKSATDVYLLSGKPTDKGHCNFDLTEGEGWRRAIALYAARKLVGGTWVNDKDEYLAPNTSHPDYDQWVDDCHIYALLHPSNNMTSMRDVEYKGKKWNIHNHFFWRTRQEAISDYGMTNSLYRDAQAHPIPYTAEEKGSIEGESVTPAWKLNGDPYFSHVLPTLNLSPLAREVFNDLNALYLKTIPYREACGDESLHLKAWDAGVYQMKKLWNEEPALKADWEALNKKHKLLASQLEGGVYTFGFLRK